MSVSLASLISQQAGKTSSQLGTDPQWLFGNNWAKRPHASRREPRFYARNREGAVKCPLPQPTREFTWDRAALWEEPGYVPQAVEVCQSLATQFQMRTLTLECVILFISLSMR